MQQESIFEVQVSLSHGNIQKMTSEYIKDNMESFEEIAGDISAISPCSQVVLGVYYLKEENEFKGKELLKSGCSDKYEGYNYALLYIDEKTIEQRNFWKYSEENAKKVLDFLMDHYGCEKSKKKNDRPKIVTNNRKRKAAKGEYYQKKKKKEAKEYKRMKQ